MIKIELVGLAFGAAYLWFKLWQRLRSWQLREDPRNLTGQGIDVSQLKPRIEQVRHNYAAARRLARGGCFHRSLLELARLAIAQMAFSEIEEYDTRRDQSNGVE